jgi:hypothetical protein
MHYKNRKLAISGYISGQLKTPTRANLKVCPGYDEFCWILKTR